MEPLWKQVDRVQDYLRTWARRRVVSSARQGAGSPIEVGGSSYGVPATTMPVSDAGTNLGVTLSFDGSPTDTFELEALRLR